jgi:TetR/AcrR family fatty acid metabolism transcriptional regulator
MMQTRKEQALDAKKRIIDATEKLIKEKDYDSLHIADIVALCGMTPGNFYHYFKSKEELFEIVDTKMFYNKIKSLNLKLNIPTVDRIESYVYDWVNLMLNYYGAKYTYNWIRHYTKNAHPQKNEDRMGIVHDHIVEFLKQGIKNNELRENTPVECIAYSISFVIFGCAAFYGMHDEKFAFNEWIKDFCCIYIRDLLAHYHVTN